MISSSLINKHHAFDTHSFANSLTFSKTALLIFSFNSDGAADNVMGFGGFYLMKNFLAERGYCKNKLKLPLEASLKKKAPLYAHKSCNHMPERISSVF